MKAFSMVLVAALAASGTTAQAQTMATHGTRLALRDSSTLSLVGTSTLHGFTCTTHTMQAVVVVDSNFLAAPLRTMQHPVQQVEVTIPVTSLKCGEDGMNNNMYKTLKTKEFPSITYSLQSYTVDSATVASDSIITHTNGNLTISGATRPVTMDVRITRDANGLAHARGTVAFKMSDFSIKPPTFFLGTLRVGDRVEISFDLLASRAPATAVGLVQH